MLSMSMQKVADILGISKATVSFVVNGKPGVSLDTANKVRDVMQRIGYTPRNIESRKSKSMKNIGGDGCGLKTGTIGVLMAENVIAKIPFYARLLESIQQQLESRGLKMAPLRYSGKSSVSRGSLRDIDGLLMCCYFKELVQEVSVPFVSIFGHPDPKDKLYADHIEPANDRIGVLAAEYFCRRGHKNVLGVDPSMSHHPAFATRLRFFLTACQENQIKANLAAIPFGDRDVHGRIIEADNIEVILKYISEYKTLSDKPTGIFIPCDSHLVVMQKCFVAAGIRPGVDVEFLGCNNEMPLLEGLQVRPATIDINPNAIAEAALVALMHRIYNPKTTGSLHKIVSIEPTLIEAGIGVKDQW